MRAIAGGGRYDKLLSLYGAMSPVPACGFGFGDCVIVELLKEKNLLPKKEVEKQIDFCVAAYNIDMQGKAMKTANLLRLGNNNNSDNDNDNNNNNNNNSGHHLITCDVMLEPKKKVAQTFDYANRIGARYIVFVAPSEWENGCVRIKDLRADAYAAEESDKQVDVKLEDLCNALEIMRLNEVQVKIRRGMASL